VGPELKLRNYSERKQFWTFKVQKVIVVLQMELLRSDSRLGSLIILSGMVHTRGESPQEELGDIWTLLNDLGFSLYATPSVCCVVAISDIRKKSEM